MNRSSVVMVALASLLLIVSAAIILFLFLRPAEESEIPNTSGNPFAFSTTSVEPGTGAAIRTIKTRQGEDITVADFTTDKQSQQIGAEASDVQFDLTPYPPYDPDVSFPLHQYDIQFNQANSEFIVTLNEEPLGGARLAAETFLRSILGLSDSQLCELNIIVGVPYSVNEGLSHYQNLGLSFCSQPYPLP